MKQWALIALLMLSGCSLNHETSDSLDKMSSQTIDKVGGFFSCIGGDGGKTPAKKGVSPTAIW